MTDTDELNMRAIDKETELRKGEGTLYDALVNATILNDTTHQISTNITKQQKVLLIIIIMHISFTIHQ